MPGAEPHRRRDDNEEWSVSASGQRRAVSGYVPRRGDGDVADRDGRERSLTAARPVLVVHVDASEIEDVAAEGGAQRGAGLVAPRRAGEEDAPGGVVVVDGRRLERVELGVEE